MKSDLVVFGEDWGRHPSSSQHLVRQLANDRRVLWVNSIGMRRPGLNRRDLGRVAQKLSDLTVRRRHKAPTPHSAEVPAGVEVMSVAAIPWPGNHLASIANAHLLGRQIRTRMAQAKLSRPVLWASLPTATPAIGRLGERAVVYYCGDDFGALTGVDHTPVLEMEYQLVKRADLIIAASDVLARRFPSHKTLHVPHGVDIALFTRPASRSALLSKTRPSAGFYGSIANWIDVDLLAKSAATLPDWDFVLIGSVETDISSLKTLPNVRLVGTIDHDQLPTFSQHWTTSLLPFRDCPQIRACNPLKLREYLATGRPVITTEFPAILPYRDLVHVARNSDEFIAALRASLNESHRAIESRCRSVANETWDARARTIDDALARL